MTDLPAHKVFFAAAAVQGAAAVGLRVLPQDPAVSVAWHSHELVFGYAMAVVAGFLLTRSSGREVALALAVWTAARLAWVVPDAPALVPATLTVAATATIAILAGRGFLRGVKRGQNVVFPALLAVLVLCDVASQAGALLSEARLARSAVLVAIVLVVLLVVVMGGRITGAALSGLAQRAGGARIPPQPGLERVLIAALAGVAIAVAAGSAVLLAAAAWTAAAGLGLRVAGWRSGLAMAGADLLALVAAQCFIAAGLAMAGAAWLAPPWPEEAPLHLVTIGGIGIATVTMLLKTHAQRERRPLPAATIAAAAALLSAAALTRGLGYAAPGLAYPVAALAWIGAMAVCLAGLLARR